MIYLIQALELKENALKSLVLCWTVGTGNLYAVEC